LVPATVRRGALQIAVSTAGASPLLGQQVRAELETRYGEEYATFCVLLAEARAVAKATLPSQDDRQRFFTALMDSEVLALIREGEVEDARRLMLSLLDAHRDQSG
jgi:precorrin-2 dehydrogenase/sirohydrochlorin ferrochelatase